VRPIRGGRSRVVASHPADPARVRRITGSSNAPAGAPRRTALDCRARDPRAQLTPDGLHVGGSPLVPLRNVRGDPLGGQLDQTGLRVADMRVEISTERADRVVGVAQIGSTGAEDRAHDRQWLTDPRPRVAEDCDGGYVGGGRGGHRSGETEPRYR